MGPLLPFAFVALSVVLVLIRRHRRYLSIKHIRGPASPSWIFGHEYAPTQQTEVGGIEFGWRREFGATWRLAGFMGTSMLMSGDPKLFQHIFHKSGYQYVKTEAQTRFVHVLAGPGLITAAPEPHRRARKLMNPSFSAATLRTFLPQFHRMVGRLSEKWKTELSGTDEIQVMVNKWLSAITLDTIGEAVFEHQYGAFDGQESSPLFRAYDNFLKNFEFKPKKSVVFFRLAWDYFPTVILDNFRYIPIHPFIGLRAIYDTYRDYGKRIIREKTSQMDAESQKIGKDVMSQLIKANMSEDPKLRLTDDEIMAEMLTLTTAGHETTGATLAFLLYELARHPEYQLRMREEIKATRAKVHARGDDTFTLEDLDSMVQCTNAMKETLRMHPSGPHLMRVATKDDVLPLSYPIVSTTGETVTEIPIKKGQAVYCSLAVYNRVPETWGEDADVWDPDRFFRPDIAKNVNVGMYGNLMSFSAGVRGCIGWRFAVVWMQMVLAELIETFDFAMPTEDIKILRAPVSAFTQPLIEGKEELGASMPLRISLAQ